MANVNCNFCGIRAKYDGKTCYGSWAYMCDHHFKEYGYPEIAGLFTVLREESEGKQHELSFENWMEEVDRYLENQCGIGSEELPDYDYVGEYEDGIDPPIVATNALMAADFF